MASEGVARPLEGVNGLTGGGEALRRCEWSQRRLKGGLEGTTKGGSCRLEKSHEVWMMMMIAAGLMWAGAAEKAEQTKK